MALSEHTLPPELESRLREEAADHGVAPDEYWRGILDGLYQAGKVREALFELHRANSNAAAAGQAAMDRLDREMEAARRRTNVAELLQSWIDEDATDDPDEIRVAEQELAEFKRAMNENRAGERPLYK